MRINLVYINKSVNKEIDMFKRKFKLIAKHLFKKLKMNENFSFSLTITNNVEIQKINKQYRGLDKPTDVISFAFLETLSENEKELFLSEIDEKELGDIIISVDKVIEQSKSYGHSIEREVCFLFVHGLLHLLGYDHDIKEKEEKMFKIQEEVLNEIGITR